MGFKFIHNNTDKVLSESDEAVERALLAVGLQAEGHAKNELSNTPKRIDTGLLRNSITYAYTGKETAIKSYKGSPVHGDNESTRRRGIVGKPAPPPHEGTYSGQAPKTPKSMPAVFLGTNVEYATYVHDGTSRMPANRFLRNAVTKYADEYKKIVKKHLQNG